MDIVEILMPGIAQNPMNYSTEEVLGTGFMLSAIATPIARSNPITLPIVAVGSYQAMYRLTKAVKSLIGN